MYPYWILFLVAAVGACWPSNRQRQQAVTSGGQILGDHGFRPRTGDRFLLFAGVATALMVGLRYEVGTDWPSYIEIFNRIAALDFPRALTSIDPGYAALNWVAANAGLGIWAVNLVCALLFMFGVVRFARHQPNPWLAMTVAIPYLIIGVGMGYTRQAVAIGLSMAGLATVSRSFSRFILWVLLGALFHRTAVILIPIVTLAYSRNRLQAAVIGAIGCVVGYYVLTSTQGLEHFQRLYITHKYEAQGAGIRLAMNLPPALLYLLFRRRFTVEPTEMRIWLIFAVLAIISFATYFFIVSTVALDRIALYIVPLQLFVFSRLPTALLAQNRQSSPLVLLIIIYSALVEFVWLNFANNAANWIPYRVYPLG